MQNVRELLKLKGGKADHSEQKVLEFYDNAYSARRCLDLADSFEKSGKMAEALAILNHATKVSQKADETLKVDLIDIKDLKAKIDIARCRCTAKVVLAQTGSQQTKTSQKFLSERQNDFVQTSKSDSSPFMIAQVPAAMQPTACTPEVFDIMKKNIRAPNLNHRIKKRVKKAPIEKAAKPAQTASRSPAPAPAPAAARAPAPAPSPAPAAAAAPAPAPPKKEEKKKAGWFGGWWS